MVVAVNSVALASELVHSLKRARMYVGGGDNADVVALARRIKNDAVGNKDAKQAYVAAGAVHALVEVAATSNAPPGVVAEALAALCSLCVRCEIGINALLAEPQALDTLLSALHAPPPLAVSHAAARTLKVLATSPYVPQSALDEIGSRPLAIAQLVALSAHSGPLCATAAATIAAVVRDPQHANIAISAGALPALLPALAPRAHPVRTDAALDALAALAAADPTVAAEHITAHGAPLCVLPLVRCTESADTRLAACRLLARLRRANALDGRQEKAEIINAVIPQLIRLLADVERTVRRNAACVLTEMVHADDNMQRQATDAGAVACLASFFSHPDISENGKTSHSAVQMPPSRVQFTPENTRGVDVDAFTAALPMAEAALEALAALCANLDEARDRVVEEAKLWPYVVKFLSCDEPKVVLAAAKCARSLTRSVKILRGDICTGQVVKLFLDLLEKSENLEIRRCVSAALCNIVINFSPVQQIFLEQRGVFSLVRLLRSEDKELRSNGLSAVKNLLFKVDCDTKRAIMNEVGYNTIEEACNDPCEEIRASAVHTLRNLACYGTKHTETEHIDMLLEAMGDRLFAVLENVLAEEQSVAVATQALYAVCNIASGTEEHKTRIMHTRIPEYLGEWIGRNDASTRIAALWVVINLARREPVKVETTATSTALVVAAAPPRMMSSARTRRASYLQVGRRSISRVHSAEQAAALMVLDSIDSATNRTTSETAASAASSDATMTDVATLENGTNAMKTEEKVEVVMDEPMKNGASGYRWRVERLRELGIENRLRSVAGDMRLEVQGRVRAALEAVTGAEDGLEYSPRSLLTPQNPGSLPPVSALRIDGISAQTGEPTDESSEGSTFTTAGEERSNLPPGLG